MECQICNKHQETLWFKKCVDCWELEQRVVLHRMGLWS